MTRTVDKPLVFVWENFGPMHMDRCEALARQFAGRRSVVGIEMVGVSSVYGWNPSIGALFRKVTLFENLPLEKVHIFRRVWALVKACVSQGRADYFFCHYEVIDVLLTTIVLRLMGRHVYVMNDSKFDDKPRSIWREIVKVLALWPYTGAIVSGLRAKEYMTFLGFRPEKIAIGYDTLSIDRIRTLAAADPAPSGSCFESRHFTVVARFVPKKNLATVIDAYADYVRSVENPRQLHLCGSGELDSELREQVMRLQLQDHVIFRGFIQSQDIAKTLANTVALLLVSVEEQFGLVVIEAQAMGVPVIYSPCCGARDDLLRSGVNGFMVEPDNPAGIALMMKLVTSDEKLWRKLAQGALDAAPIGDVAGFGRGVGQLCDGNGRG
jgi:glycosyltransferase involved in cell wall biosynthesis